MTGGGPLPENKAMKAKRLITASSSRFAAQLFNLITVAVLLISLTALLMFFVL